MEQYPAAVHDRLLRAIDAGIAKTQAARSSVSTPGMIARWRQ